MRRRPRSLPVPVVALGLLFANGSSVPLTGRDGMMSRRKLIQFPVGYGDLDREYLLCRCEGFLVCREDGARLGRVAELHYLSRLDQPDELTVRVGVFGLRRRTYPVEAVQEVLARERRLILAPDAAAT